MDEHSLRTALKDLDLPAIHYFASIGSTNDLALQLAADGAADGTLVVADQQIAGRGRLERRWLTAPGGALAFSLVLRPSEQPGPDLALYAPLCGLAVCRALEQLGPLVPEIKWPNDVLLDRRKTCGVLVEAVWQGETLQGLVAGIGVNVASSAVPPDQEVLFPATCIEAALGHPLRRELLLAAILRAFQAERSRLGTPQFIADWESHLAFRDEWVRLEEPGSQREGRIRGVTPQGSLLLRSSDGIDFEVQAGDVRLRPVC